MIKTNIKMRVTPEQSRRVQEICFENGIYWRSMHSKDKVTIFSDYLYIDDYITHDSLNNFTYFKEAAEKEIDADLFIKTNGTCEESIREREQYYCKSAIQYYDYVVENIMDEETYLTKYTSQPKDLESALKKIENLHIALNKKREKNKNQALEITKLLEQKKDLQEINDSKNEHIRQLESNITFKVEESKQLQKENSFVKSEHNKILEKLNESRKETTISYDIRYNLEKKLKEKDTIISYLESKLK